MKPLAPLLALALLAAPALAQATVETRLPAPAWVAYTLDLKQGDVVLVEFGIASEGRLSEGSFALFMTPEEPWTKIGVGSGTTDGRADGVQLTLLGGEGPRVDVLGGPAEPWNPRHYASLRVEFTASRPDVWHFVVVGGGRADDDVELVVKMATSAPWTQTTGLDAHYAYGAEDFAVPASATVAARAQSAHLAVAGERSFTAREHAYYDVETGGACACYLEGHDAGVQAWDTLQGYFEADGPPGTRTLRFAASTTAGINPTAHPGYGAHPRGISLLAADVTFPPRPTR